MKKIIIYILLGCLLCGCNNKEVLKEPIQEQKTNDIEIKEEIDYELPETELFRANENDVYIEFPLEGKFRAKIKVTGDKVVIGNAYSKIEMSGYLDELKNKITSAVNYIYMLEYKYYVKDHENIIFENNEYTLGHGNLTHNDLVWEYHVQQREKLVDINLRHTNESNNKDFIIETTWVSDDMDLIMKNIEFALTKLDLKVL